MGPTEVSATATQLLSLPNSTASSLLWIQRSISIKFPVQTTIFESVSKRTNLRYLAPLDKNLDYAQPDLEEGGLHRHHSGKWPKATGHDHLPALSIPSLRPIDESSVPVTIQFPQDPLGNTLPTPANSLCKPLPWSGKRW